MEVTELPVPRQICKSPHTVLTPPTHTHERGHNVTLKGASHPGQHDYHEGTRKADAILHETLSPNTHKKRRKRGRGEGKGEEKKGERSILSHIFGSSPCSQLLRRLRQEGS